MPVDSFDGFVHISGVAFRETFSVGVCEYVTIMIDQDVTSATHATDWMDLRGSDRQKIYPPLCSVLTKIYFRTIHIAEGWLDGGGGGGGGSGGNGGGIIYISLESLQ